MTKTFPLMKMSCRWSLHSDTKVRNKNRIWWLYVSFFSMVYKRLNENILTINIIFLHAEQGITDEERRLILEEHNFLRQTVATGHVAGMTRKVIILSNRELLSGFVIVCMFLKKIIITRLFICALLCIFGGKYHITL